MFEDGIFQICIPQVKRLGENLSSQMVQALMNEFKNKRISIIQETLSESRFLNRHL